jgi:carnitine-CoA ligase
MDKDLSRKITIDEIPHLPGTSHTGAPMRVSRDQRDQFEHVTLVSVAHPGPQPAEFPPDLVEGFHTLALLDAMTELARPLDPATTYAYNYGLERVRWISPVRIGDDLQSEFTCMAVEAKGDGWIVHWGCTITVAGATRPAMVADWLVYVLPRRNN